MKLKLTLALVSLCFLITGCGGGSNDSRAVPAPPANNNNGSVTTAILTAQFDPANGVLPLPNNLLLSGTTDLTLNPPVADPMDFSDPLVAVSALDGFSTTAPWSANFIDANGAAGSLATATVVPGGSVRVFKVTTVQGTPIVNGVERELTPGVEYVAVAASASSVAILPLQPLQELSTYMAVITNDITDSNGNDVTPSQTYFIGKRTSPLVDATGASTDPLLDNATAQALEPLRQIINSQEAAAASQGIDTDDIVLSWTANTQAITPVLSILRSIAQPAPTIAAPTGLTTAAAVPGAAGIADIIVGTISLPYYLGIPSADNPIAPLNQFWTANPGAYIPPFDAFGLDPTSTNVTVANPFPVQTGTQTVPVLITVPNAMSGQTKPAAGWPVVIFQHGITRNRTDALAIAEGLALAGFAVVSIDQPLHGVVPDVEPALAPFYIENHPVFGALANERTFDADYVSNTTGAPGPDGLIDGSGTHTINLASLLTSRDNLRQASADLSVLAVTVPTISFDGDAVPDFDGSNINFVGQSLGSIVGTSFVAVEPTVTNAALSVPGGGIVYMLNGSETFGPRIRAGLSAAGVEPGTPDFDAFLFAAQTVIDSADPINWASAMAAGNTVLLHEVIGDAVIPNAVATAPLAGTEPLIRQMGLAVINATTADPMGLRVGARFIPPASHGSLLSPVDSLAATVEMQGQIGSFIKTGGTTVVVDNPSVLAGE